MLIGVDRVFEDFSDQEQQNLMEKLNLRNIHGKTPLEMACVLGKDAILSELIKKGADVNLYTNNGLFSREIRFSYADCDLSCV